MLKPGDKITVHFINHWNYKQPTETFSGYTGKEFEVKEEKGKLGFDGNTNRSPYTDKGEIFTPFQIYAWTVIFRNTETGQLYRYSETKKGLEDITNLNDDYTANINWLN